MIAEKVNSAIQIISYVPIGACYRSALMVVWMEIVILHPFQAAKLTLIANNSNSVIQIVKRVLITALWPSVHMVV